LDKFSLLLRKPLTEDRVLSAKMLWASILSVGVALESVVATIEFQALKTLFNEGSYYSLASSFVLGLQTMALIAVGLVPPLFHGIRAALSQDAAPPMVDTKLLPSLTIQIPVRNEPFETVKTRSLASALANRENYPQGRLKIQVVDNSDSGKYTELETYCMQQGIQFIHRDGIRGGKSHNLNLGLEKTDTTHVFVIDADIRLEDDALSKVMGEFVDNPDLSFVVIEAVTKNFEGEKHLFAKSLEKLRNQNSFMVQTMDDYGLAPLAGYSAAINISHLRNAGGWSETHVGEDWEMGFRLAIILGARGKRISYTRAEDPALIDISRWRTQQYRWAFGTIQTLRDHAIPFIRAKKLSWHEKISLLFRMSSYPTLSFLYTIPTMLATPLVIAAASEEPHANHEHSTFLSVVRWLTLLSFPLVLSLKNLIREGKIPKLWDGLKNVYLGMFMGAGLILEITKACLNSLIYKNDYFRVTPKGKHNNPSLWQTIKNNKYEFALGMIFSVPLLFIGWGYLWVAFIGAGIIISPLLSWFSNYRTRT
jgi:cellulose synthase/poly-beta-1,6-N-acetylglucosamine synthase-like glycosyltransferase